MRPFALCGLAVTSLLLVATSSAAYNCSDGGPGLVKDPRGPSKGASLRTCGSVGAPDTGGYVHLLQVPVVPYEITSICAAMCNVDSVAPLNVTVRGLLYDAYLVSPAPPDWRPFSSRFTFSPAAVVTLPQSLCQVSGYTVSLNVTLVAYQKMIFLGIVANPGCGAGAVSFGCNASVYPSANRVWARRESIASLEDVTPALGVLSVRAKGMRHTTLATEVVPGWSCGTGTYDDRAKCDCGCGLEDPDCMYLTKISDRCSVGKVCLAGSCVSHGWDTSKLGCNPAGWDIDHTCSCGCTAAGGIMDPDCQIDGAAPLTAGACSGMALPHCVAGKCEDDWKCEARRYNDSTTCDCGCGVPDPDCLNPSLPLSCAPGLSCQDLTCVPPGWYCPGRWYGNGTACDCRCGAYDKDCDDVSLNVSRCAPNLECHYDASCIQPFCGNHYPDARSLKEQCDGGTGCSLDNCTCLPGYRPNVPLDDSCTEICGDGVVVGREECEKPSPFCNATTCMCLPEHPLSGSVCSGCGDGILNPGEQCDGGTGCLIGSCTCADGYEPETPRSLSCRSLQSLQSSSKAQTERALVSILIPIIGAFCAVLALSAVSLIIGAFLLRRIRPKKTIVGANRIVDPVPLELVSLPAAPTAIQGLTGTVGHSGGSSGTPEFRIVSTEAAAVNPGFQNTPPVIFEVSGSPMFMHTQFNGALGSGDIFVPAPFTGSPLNTAFFSTDQQQPPYVTPAPQHTSSLLSQPSQGSQP